MKENGNSIKYGECRCCSNVGQHRDLMLEYEWNGTREVYFDTFLECFNLFLSTNPKKGNLICTSCILRLRDANSFKKMVTEAEENLLSYDVLNQDNSIVLLQTEELDLQDEQHLVEIKNEKSDVNSECSKFEQNGANSDTNSLLEENMVLLQTEELNLQDQQHLVEIKNEKSDVKSECSEFEQNGANSDTDSLLEENIVKNNTKSYTDSIRETFSKVENDNRTQKLAYIHNTMIILENSNVTPFKPKHQAGFLCFYCRMMLEDVIIMREHQQKHTKIELKRVLWSYGAENFVVYVDTTDLKCTICDKNVENLNELKLHLIKDHKKKMQDYPDCVVPFKLSSSNFECQVCKSYFRTFGSIERHMNVHFRNYVCKECGTGYMTKCRLKVHSKQHIGGSSQCETCKKVYATPIKLKSHIDVVHKMIKRFKCAKCDERFTEYFRRQKHMVEVHGVAPLEYKCNICKKTFDRKYVMSMHMKRDHLEDKDYQCEMCSYRCFTKKQLKLHMIKHNGERIFECTICKKSYARKKTLREHMRIHNKDRRYACKACGQAFVQNCSLKRHVKTHHPELLTP